MGEPGGCDQLLGRDAAGGNDERWKDEDDLDNLRMRTVAYLDIRIQSMNVIAARFCRSP